MKSSIRALVFISLLLVSVAGCLPRQIVIREMGDLLVAGLPALEADGDLATAELALPSQIASVQGLLANAPEDQTLLILLARLHASFAFAFLDTRLDDGTPAPAATPVREELLRQADRHTRKGADYGWRALCLRHPKLAQLPEAQRMNQLETLERDDVPALFWWGFSCALSGMRHSDSARGLMQADIGQQAMSRVVALSADYYHGLAHLVLMVAAAARPVALGGDLAAAEDHFRQLKALAGNDFLMADLLYARYVLVSRQDRVWFKNLLEQIIARSENPSAYGLLNAVAALRAKRYAAHIDLWFE